METSLSVQNDAILKKAKWWIVSSLVLVLVSYCWICFCMPILENYYLWAEPGPDNIFYIIHGIVGYVSPVLFIVGCVLLLVKHPVKSIRVGSTMFLISTALGLLFFILNMYLWDDVLENIFPDQLEKQQIWQIIIHYVAYFITSVISLMGVAALWKNKQIKTNYGNILRLLILVSFVTMVLYIPNNMWFIKYEMEYIQMGESTYLTHVYKYFSNLFANGLYIPQIIFTILSILEIYCYCKLLKTPSLMPTEDNPDELPYSYCPTKIEIGFVICVALFIGCIFLTFQFV